MDPTQIKAEQQILHFALLQAIGKFEEKTGVKVTKVEYKPGVSEVMTTCESSLQEAPATPSFHTR